MQAPVLPAADAAAPDNPNYLTPSERRAYRELASRDQDLMQLSPRTLLRLLAQVEAQEPQLLLHQRREKGLCEQVRQWENMGEGFPDYYDAAQEVKAILEDMHYGDPAYQEPDMEHDGTGWAVPRPLRNELRGLAS